MNEDLHKVPPHSIEAEQAVLGGIMLEPQLWTDVARRITNEDFYIPAHRCIYTALQSCEAGTKALDIISVGDILSSEGSLENIGGLEYLGGLVANTPSTANIESYADIVRDKSVIRGLIAVGRQTQQSGFDTEGRDAKELLALAEQRLGVLSEGGLVEGGPAQFDPMLKYAVDELDRRLHNAGALTGLSTGFDDLDDMTSGLQKGDLVIVAARPSMGKTAFAMNLIEHAILSQDGPVLAFSMEMPAQSLTLRMISSVGNILSDRIRKGPLMEEDWSKLSVAMHKLKGRPLYIDDTPALTPQELRARCKSVARKHGNLKMIMIDYLQLMQVPSMAGNREQEISMISRSLKAIAREFECPVVALSQLSRAVEKRSPPRPMNSDLRDSGGIEQDADVIMFLYREGYYVSDKLEDERLAEVIIGKQRNGPTGSVNLDFIGEYTRFQNRPKPGNYQ
ncbi:MAG: replicative DNA helicase [Motiliproteus sp.]